MKWLSLKLRRGATTHNKKRSSGQSSAEFALTLPITLGLLFGIIQFGYILFTYSFLAFAARSGARYAMMHSSQSPQPASTASITSYVKGLASGLDQTKLTITPSWPTTTTPGSLVKVQVNYVFIPFAAFLPSGSITLSSTAQTTIVY